MNNHTCQEKQLKRLGDIRDSEYYEVFREKVIELIPEKLLEDGGKRFLEFIKILGNLPQNEFDELLEDMDSMGKEGVIYRLKRAERNIK